MKLRIWAIAAFIALVSVGISHAVYAENTTQLVSTRGNHSYIYLNINGKAADNTIEILEALNRFEHEHPDLEVTSWSLLSKEATYGYGPYIYGIWVNHKPREKK